MLAALSIGTARTTKWLRSPEETAGIRQGVTSSGRACHRAARRFGIVLMCDPPCAIRFDKPPIAQSPQGHLPSKAGRVPSRHRSHRSHEGPATETLSIPRGRNTEHMSFNIDHVQSVSGSSNMTMSSVLSAQTASKSSATPRAGRIV